MSTTATHRRAASAVLSALALLAAAAPSAHAEPVHEVAAGESLWQIAALNGLSPSALAAYNGLSATAGVQAGQVVRIPAAGAPAGTAPSSATSSAGGSAVSGTSATAPPAASSGTGPSAGGIVVQPGDSLTAIATRQGVSVTALAAHNGLTASAVLPAGRSLSLPARGTGTGPSSSGTGTATSSAGTASAGARAATATTATTTGSGSTTASGSTTGASTSAPASGSRVTAGDVAATAAQNGVPGSLASAIAWQESGFDNRAVSSVGARGVMQVMPGTWGWIRSNLAGRALDPSSAADNVQAGTLYLRHLLQQTGGDADQAAAAYYQGLSSVRSRGMYDDTKRYVENVRALRSRFGG